MGEIKSGSVKAGLNELLEKVKEVYGGDGKVKVKKKKKKKKVYSFKYSGPKKAGKLLEGAFHKVMKLQKKSEKWKFTQKIEVSHITKGEKGTKGTKGKKGKGGARGAKGAKGTKG